MYAHYYKDKFTEDDLILELLVHGNKAGQEVVPLIVTENTQEESF